MQKWGTGWVTGLPMSQSSYRVSHKHMQKVSHGTSSPDLVSHAEQGGPGLTTAQYVEPQHFLTRLESHEEMRNRVDHRTSYVAEKLLGWATSTCRRLGTALPHQILCHRTGWTMATAQFVSQNSYNEPQHFLTTLVHAETFPTTPCISSKEKLMLLSLYHKLFWFAALRYRPSHTHTHTRTTAATLHQAHNSLPCIPSVFVCSGTATLAGSLIHSRRDVLLGLKCAPWFQHDVDTHSHIIIA